MSLSRLISNISILVWLLPPLRQFRGKFFYYFLLHAVSDPLAIVLVKNNLYSLPLYLVKDLFLMLLLWKPYYIRKKIIYLIPLSLLIFIASSKIHFTTAHYMIAGIHGIITYLIFKMFLNDVIEIKKIKMFYILILLYELSVILKFFYTINFSHVGVYFYNITTVFEILLGILFVFIREDDIRFSIPIMKAIGEKEE